MSELRRAALEGVVHTPNFERWAAGMVESTTEYDFAELPPVLRERLLRWCEDFARWADIGTPYREAEGDS